MTLMTSGDIQNAVNLFVQRLGWDRSPEPLHSSAQHPLVESFLAVRASLVTANA